MTTSSQTDGRRLRSERSRLAVTDAILALLNEGDSHPSVERVASRAGVSVRSVFRHFEDLDSLYEAAIVRCIERIAPMLEWNPDLSAPFEDRARAYVVHRSRIHEETAPVRQLAERLRRTSPGIDGILTGLRRDRRAEIAQTFEPELAGRPKRDRDELIEAIDVAMTWASWASLRFEQGCSVARARKVVTMLVEGLFAALTV